MSLNKFEQKALVFKCIDKIRFLNAVDEKILIETLDEIKAIKDADFDFISRLLIKEINPDYQKVGTALFYMADYLSPESTKDYVLNELNSSRVSDNKKIFLINMLSANGVKIPPEELDIYLNNPDEAINFETKKFLDGAKVDPDQQIDFLDFYFSSSELERKELLNSITNDFSGDRLINVLSPLLLTVDDIQTISYCLDITERTQSLMCVKSLMYLSLYKGSSKIAKRAAKILRKMEMKGIYDSDKLYEFYRNLMSDFDEPVCKVTFPDGNSNFSAVISRKTKQGAYYVLFAALNITLGPFSCFGFSSLSKSEYETVLKRFFGDYRQIVLPPSDAKRILFDLTKKRISLNKIIPYEFYCWERLTDDIKPSEFSLGELLIEGLKEHKIDDKEKKLIYNSPFVQNWFYRYSKNNSSFSCLIDKISYLNENNVAKMDEYVADAAKDDSIVSNLKLRILYLSYFLKTGGYNDLADIFYSLFQDEANMIEFASNVLKRSIYEYMLVLRLPKGASKSDIFKSVKKSDKPVFNPKNFIHYIEKNWVE